MKKLTISASAKFQEEIIKWRDYFIDNGYDVINYPKPINQDIESEYRKTYIDFLKSLNDTDILFVVNECKNDIDGYIGAAVFAEISFIVINNILNNLKKEVWILNMPSKEVQSYKEIENFIKLGWIKIFDEKEIGK